MYFQVVYWHKPDNMLSEYDVLLSLGNFNGVRRTFEDTRAVDNSGPWPITIYYVEAPEEAGTYLRLKGYDVTVLNEEPRPLKLKRITSYLDQCVKNSS